VRCPAQAAAEERQMPGAGTDKTQEWPAYGGPAIILVEPQMG
jgi:hypothetical protein